MTEEESVTDELARRAKWIVRKNGGFSADRNNVTIVGRFYVIAHMSGRIDVRIALSPGDLVFRIGRRGFDDIFESKAIDALEDMRKFMVLDDLADA